ncbi:hypothetical protein RMATCC62417_05196 [Rhizopus microsporus]|nr:hypothetical protein RMATCC62417_05196 [Rhizopus microsporus]
MHRTIDCYQHKKQQRRPIHTRITNDESHDPMDLDQPLAVKIESIVAENSINYVNNQTDSTPATTTLLSQFENHRKSLQRPHCEKMGQFRHNGFTKTDPPMPIFRCHECGKTFKARTMMYIVQSLVSSNSLVSSPNNETSGVCHSIQSTQNSTRYAALTGNDRRLSTKLTAACAEIANLGQQVTQLQEQAAQQSMNMNQPNLHEDDNHLNSGNFPALPSQTSPCHDPQRISQIKRSLAEHEQQRQLQRQEAAGRLLQPPSENQRFQYVYLPTKSRVPIGQICTCLRKRYYEQPHTGCTLSRPQYYCVTCE